MAVCIVSFNNPDDVEACVQSLSASSYSAFTIVICENGSLDAFRELRRRLPKRLPAGQNLTVLHGSDNPGFAGGVNRCIEASLDADAWWILNPDTRPEPGALRALVTRLNSGDADAVGGRLYYPDGTLQAVGGRWRPFLARVEAIGKGASKDAQVDPVSVEKAMSFIHGASLLVSKAFLSRVGPMREDYFLYCEEVEWCLRALKLGLSLGFAQDARVLHAQGTTTGSADDLRDRPWLPIYLDERNKLLVVRDTKPAALFTAIPSALALIMLRFALRGAWRQFAYALEGWLAGVRGKRGKPGHIRSVAR